MKKLLSVALLLACCFYQAEAQTVISFFSWDIAGADERIADVGPNATNSGSVAEAQPTGNGTPQGCAPGCAQILFGTCATRQNINLVVPNPGNMFDLPEIQFSIDYNKRNRNETEAWFFSRRENFAGSARFFMGSEYSKFNMKFSTDNGAGGLNQHDFTVFGFFGGGTPDNIPNDNTWRNFRFVYHQSTGIAEAYINGTLATTYNTGTPGAAMMWPTNPLSIGETADNQGFDETIFDNAEVAEPIILPVEYNFLFGEQVGQRNRLSWETSNEVNSAYFEVQKLFEGEEPVVLGRVEAQGFSQENQGYEFFDYNPQPGTNYYRLHQFDQNGSSELSSVFAVNFDESRYGMLATYPNPVVSGDPVHVRYRKADEKWVRLQVFDLSGTLLLQEDYHPEREMSTFDIDTQALSPGVYFVRLVGGPDVYTSKILVSQ